MPYFIRSMRPHNSDEIWFIDESIAYDAFADRTHLAREFRARDGETALDRMRAETPWLNDSNPFHQTSLDLGQFYRRIARPLFGGQESTRLWCPSLHLEPTVVASSQGQALSLLRLLQRVCQTVQPGPKTFGAFGHDIRNLLILACTEVETHWRGVLVANGAQRKTFTTNDYVKLVDILRLRDFAVSFPAFPSLEPMRPFENWGLTDKPTADLTWYADYNAVKHNREEEFERANLLCAFQALSAVAVMLVAQYGKWGLGHQTELSQFFIMRDVPEWPQSDVYIRDPKLSPGTQTHTQFAPINHPQLEALRDKPKRAACISRSI
jgi:hypothetical protein